MDTTTAAPAIPAAEISSRFPDIDIAEGEVYAGLSRDRDTGTWHHVVLLPSLPDKDLNWQEAIDWARSMGGELPTRWESALLYANCRQTIDTNYWYWTASPYAGDERYAWCQYFDDGCQDYRQDTHFRARAVRRVPV